jgi:hypothetical protein
MNVLCMKSCEEGAFSQIKGIVETEIYTVLDSREMPGHGLCYLIFIENNTRYWYTASHFIPLSEIDERDYAEELLDRIFQPVHSSHSNKSNEHSKIH